MNRLPDHFLADLESLVQAESKTHNVPAMTQCAGVLSRIADRVLGPGARPTVTPTAAGPVLQWRFGDGPPRVGLVGHYDTVHPIGTLDQFPFHLDGDRAFGPGTYDMKAGLLTMLHAAALVQRDPACRDGLVVYCCPDEEIGSVSSLPVLSALAANGMRVALVFEGAGPGGAVYTARKSGMWLNIAFHGAPAHASRPEEGTNALTAMLRLGTRIIADLHESTFGTTVVATMANAGDAINSAPGYATLTVDCRTLTADAQEMVYRSICGRAARLSPVNAEVSVLHRFPPMPAAMSKPIYETVMTAAKSADLAPPPSATGFGVSDASHLAALGIFVLDGLGPLGGDDHSPREWIDLPSVPDRVTLVAEALPHLIALANVPEGR